MIRYLYKFSDKKAGVGTRLHYPLPNSGFVWVHAAAPTATELSSIAKNFKIPRKYLEAFEKEGRTRRYSFKPLVFTLVDYYARNGKIEVENVLYILDHNYLVTVSPKKLEHYDEIFSIIAAKLEAGELKDFESNVGYLFYEIFRADVENNFHVLSFSEKRISLIEERIIKSEDLRQRLQEVIRQKRDLLQMWRRFWESSKLIFTIKYGLTPLKMTPALMRLFDDIHDTYIYQMQMVSIQREALTDALTINETVISNNLAKLSNKINESIKRLTWVMLLFTGIATVLTVPNTFATFFGIPELPFTGKDWPLIGLTLFGATIVPLAWFYLYWRKVHKEAEK